MFRPTALALLLATPAVLAQTVPDWAAPIERSEAPADPDVTPPPPTIPVDGGLALLALAGAALAARRLRSA